MLNSLILLSSVLTQTCGQAFMLLTGNTADLPCTDKLSTCPTFGQDACQDPYTAWAMENCRNFCGFCQGNTTPTSSPVTTASHVVGKITTAPPPCVDTRTDCDIFGKSVCNDPKYNPWAKENCRLYCRLCPVCIDKLDDCNQYGKGSCQGAYYSWAKDNCRQYCGFCHGPTTQKPPCRNKIQNCNQYPGDVCTSDRYSEWAEENCNKHCGFCSDGSTVGSSAVITWPFFLLDLLEQYTMWTSLLVLSLAFTQIYGQGFQLFVGTTASTAKCEDKLDNCLSFGNDSCVGKYEVFARENCNRYCGYCQGAPTPAPACEDKKTDCEKYPKSTCTDQRYKQWAYDNCYYYCRLCTPEQLRIKDSQITTIPPACSQPQPTLAVPVPTFAPQVPGSACNSSLRLIQCRLIVVAFGELVEIIMAWKVSLFYSVLVAVCVFSVQSQEQEVDCVDYIETADSMFKEPTVVYTKFENSKIWNMTLVERRSFYMCDPPEEKFGIGLDEKEWWVFHGCGGLFEIWECAPPGEKLVLKPNPDVTMTQDEADKKAKTQISSDGSNAQKKLNGF
ncbi:unnamed protein product [Mytilus coruscus]|uniref:ShKT domain-containing protein n=1 Tax=Mytilus coruscus TaxID=42192 RepID=A0A6J8EIX5_MYTCO|nr:unnamed protein product [Mytilus coruscus]